MIALWTLAQTTPLPTPFDGGLIRAVVGAAAVLGILLLLASLLRRGVISLPGQRAVRSLLVETALSLGDRRSVVIVSVEGRRLLLGLTATQVSVLTELAPVAPSFDQAMSRAAQPPAGGAA